MNKIKEIEKMVDRENWITNECTYDFRNFQTISTFTREIYNDKFTFKKSWGRLK